MPANQRFLVTLCARNRADLAGLVAHHVDVFRHTVRPLREVPAWLQGVAGLGPESVTADALMSLYMVGKLVRQGFSVTVRQHEADMPSPAQWRITPEAWLAQAKGSSS